MSLYDLHLDRVEMEPAHLKELRPAIPSMPYFGDMAEYVTGGWQKNLVPPLRESVLAFSAVFACVTLIAGDISKLRLKLLRRQRDGTWQEIEGGDDFSPFLKVFRKPNHYETRKQFIRNWITMKLLHGNSYQLKQRKDLRGMVTALYVLDPTLTTPLVAEDGSIFYRLGKDRLSGFGEEDIIVPASEIIHDRMTCFWHPLVGVTPIYAGASSAAQGNSIQGNSEQFFKNQSRPSGLLIYPQKIDQAQVDKVSAAFNTGFRGANIGRFAVLGGAVEYKPLTIPAHDAQLIEQLRWTVEDVARCFHVPPYKLGLQTNVTFSNAAQLNQDYYSQCLQDLIEDLEALLDEGLGLPDDIGVEFDLDGLLRMDPVSQAEIDQKEVQAAILKPNEARKKRNRPPVPGGDATYMQEQNFSLEALAKRDKQEDPFAKSKPPAPAPAAPEKTDETDAQEEVKALISRFNRSQFRV